MITQKEKNELIGKALILHQDVLKLISIELNTIKERITKLEEEK